MLFASVPRFLSSMLSMYEKFTLSSTMGTDRNFDANSNASRPSLWAFRLSLSPQAFFRPMAVY